MIPSTTANLRSPVSSFQLRVVLIVYSDPPLRVRTCRSHQYLVIENVLREWFVRPSVVRLARCIFNRKVIATTMAAFLLYGTGTVCS
jgi:hypothetical protein